MYLRKTDSRCLAVIVLFLFLPILVCSREINLEYPEKIDTEEFSISLTLNDFPDDNYDVKIDFLSNGKRITKISDPISGYKSTYYFISDAIKSGNNQASFNFKITEEYNGKSDIEVKIRDSKDKTFSFKGYATEMSFSEIIEETNKENDENVDENKVDNDKKTDKNNNENAQDKQIENRQENSTTLILQEQFSNNNEIIHLKSSPQDIKNQEDKQKIVVVKSKDNKIKEYSLYGFTLFLIFILALLITKKI